MRRGDRYSLAVMMVSMVSIAASSLSVTDGPSDVAPYYIGTLPSLPVSSSSVPLSGTLDTDTDLNWYENVVQELPPIEEGSRKDIKIIASKDGCYAPQNTLGTPSVKAPTIPPPPSTAPPQDKPSGTVEKGLSCGPGSMRWRFKTGNIVSSSASFSPDGSVMYIGSRDGSLYALRTSDGSLLWKTSPEHAVDVIPATDGDIVVYGSSSARLTALSASDGSPLWSYDAGDGVFQSSPLIVGDRVFSGGGGHFVRAFDRSSGKVLWEKELGMWVQSSAAHKDGVLYIGSDAGFLMAYDASTGREKWRFAAKMPGEPNEETSVTADPKITPDGHRSNILSTPRFSGNLVFITSIAGKVYAVDTDTGAEVWSFLGERIVTDTTVSGDVLYTHSDMGILRALDIKTGKVLWGAKTGTAQNYWPGPYQTASAPAVYKNQVFVGGTDGDVTAYDSSNGSVLWSFRTGDWVMSSPRVLGTTLFVGSNDGWIYALNLE